MRSGSSQATGSAAGSPTTQSSFSPSSGRITSSSSGIFHHYRMRTTRGQCGRRCCFRSLAMRVSTVWKGGEKGSPGLIERVLRRPRDHFCVRGYASKLPF